VPGTKDRKSTVSFKLANLMIDQIEEIARAEGVSKSRWVEKLVLRELDRSGGPPTQKELQKAKAQKSREEKLKAQELIKATKRLELLKDRLKFSRTKNPILLEEIYEAERQVDLLATGEAKPQRPRSEWYPEELKKYKKEFKEEPFAGLPQE